MPQTRLLSPPWTTGITDSNSANGIFLPATVWMPSGRVAAVRVVWELIGLLANFGARPALQTANTIDGATTTVTIDSTFQTTSQVYFPSDWYDAKTAMAGKRLVRLGWEIKNTSAAATTAGRLHGAFEILISG